MVSRIFYMKKNIILVTLGLVIGLIIGSTKGDDVLELIETGQVSEKAVLPLSSKLEIANRFSEKIHAYLPKPTPVEYRGKKVTSELEVYPDKYSFELFCEGKKVAWLVFNKNEAFLEGDWLE